MITATKPKTISRGAFLRNLAFGASFLPAAALVAQTNEPPGAADLAPDLGNLRTFVELARSDIRNEKAIILSQNLPLTEDEAVEFWPLQREYEDQLSRLLDKRYEAIVQFINTYKTMTDAQATDLAGKTFDLEEQRTALKRKYFKQFSTVIPAVKAARFFQIENQLNMVLDLRLAASMPLIK